jgi:hypothetical protein
MSTTLGANSELVKVIIDSLGIPKTFSKLVITIDKTGMQVDVAYWPTTDGQVIVPNDERTIPRQRDWGADFHI